MNELWQIVVLNLRGMWHRRWIGLAAAWLIAIVGVAIAYEIPEKYEATARVYVDTDTLLKPLMAGLAIQPNIDQQVGLMSRTLISRPNVEKLVRMADLDLMARSPAERDALIDATMRTIKLTGSNATNLYLLAYRDADPTRARQVVQSLLTIFIESSLGDKRQDSQAAVRFLDDQIKSYEKSLQAAEDRLKEFRLKYMGVAGRDGHDYYSRLEQVRTAIEVARLELNAAEQARDAYKRELAGEAPMLLPEPKADESAPEYDGRIAAIRKHLDELRQKFTDQHPDVVNAKRLIDQLEEQRRTELEARRKAAAAAPRGTLPPDQSPVFQQIRIALAESEARVAAARAKLAGLEAQYGSLRGQARMVPQVEAEFSQLNRDYEVQKKTYENLLARREAASMGMDAQNTGGAQFRVIDPPRVSPNPVMPNRLALLGMAFAAALAGGLLASFVANQLLPTIHDARTLRAVTNRPVLGMVSLIPSMALARRRRWHAFYFAGGISSLLASFAAIVAFALLAGRAA